jgi:hypothetical protein
MAEFALKRKCFREAQWKTVKGKDVHHLNLFGNDLLLIDPGIVPRRGEAAGCLLGCPCQRA